MTLHARASPLLMGSEGLALDYQRLEDTQRQRSEGLQQGDRLQELSPMRVTESDTEPDYGTQPIRLRCLRVYLLPLT